MTLSTVQLFQTALIPGFAEKFYQLGAKTHCKTLNASKKYAKLMDSAQGVLRARHFAYLETAAIIASVVFVAFNAAYATIPVFVAIGLVALADLYTFKVLHKKVMDLDQAFLDIGYLNLI